MESHKMKKQLSTAYRYSFTRLALNYYTYYESMAGLDQIPPAVSSCNEELNRILDAFIQGEGKEEEITALRERVKHQMEIMTAYTDCCENYEYAVNRIERRFLPQERRDLDSARFFQAMSDYILQSKDGAVMNARISAALSQMPVRLTKQKFFSIVESAMEPFKGSSKQALEEQMYLLRTGAMLDLPKDMSDGYEDLWEALAHLEVIDYRAVTEEEYWARKQEIVYISDNVRDYVTAFTMLEEIVNDLYVMILSKPEAMVDAQEEALLTSISSEVLKKFREGKREPVDDQVTGLLSGLEGKQETYFDRYLEQLIPAESIKDPEEPMARRIFLVDLLLSESPFASLMIRPESEKGKVEPELLGQELGRFFQDLAELFTRLARPVTRAVMARILSQLPLWFTDTDDMLAFLRNSLESCTDQKEKQTSMELMKILMERE